MKEFLKRILAEQERQLAEINTRAQNSQDVDEVRSLGVQRNELEGKIAETRAKLAEIEQSGGAGNTVTPPANSSPAEPARRDFDPLGTYGANPRSLGGAASEEENDDIYATRKYEEAFRNFVTRGIPIPNEFHDARPGAITREHQTTLVSDVSAVIPTHWLDAVTEKLNSIGKIWNRCLHTSIPARVAVPIADIIPEASWVGEGASESKKYGAKDQIVFQAYGLECKIATSLLAETLTLESFKANFIEVATKAVIKAGEIAVFNGDGNNKFTGILEEKRIPEANIIKLTAEDLKDWEAWQSKFFANLSDEYADGSFYMARSTYFSKINGMVDKNGQPIARVTIGLSGKPEYNFCGNEVVTTAKYILPSADSASVGDIIGVFGDLAQYCINSPLPMQVDEWIDRDTRQKKRAVVLGADGHVIDPNAFYLIKLVAAE